MDFAVLDYSLIVAALRHHASSESLGKRAPACDTRPTCHSCMKNTPPLSCTAFTMGFHASTCSGRLMPGVLGYLRGRGAVGRLRPDQGVALCQEWAGSTTRRRYMSGHAVLLSGPRWMHAGWSCSESISASGSTRCSLLLLPLQSGAMPRL